VWEFGFGVGGVALVSRAFDEDFLARVEPWNNWLVAMPGLAGAGLMMFLVSRHTVVTLVSLLPRIHRRTVEKSP
jgi:hypothetical protein